MYTNPFYKAGVYNNISENEIIKLTANPAFLQEGIIIEY